MEKHSERGDWDITGGGGGGVIEVLLFKGIDNYSGEGVIEFFVGHFENGSSDVSRKIINDHTIFFIINVNFGKKIKQNFIKTYCNTCQMVFKTS